MKRNILKDFLKNAEGALTGFGLFLLIACLAIGGLALDVANAYMARTQLQATADAVAHAALYSLDVSKSSSIAKTEALEVAAEMMPAGKFGNVLDADSIQFGTWDATSQTFTIDPLSDDAVMVDVSRAADRANPLATHFLRFVGLNSWNVRTRSVFETYRPTCFREGFVAEERVDMQSNNDYANGFCIHSQTHVEMNSDNEYDPTTVVSMPDKRDVDVPSDDLSTNPGLAGALRSGSYQLRVLNDLEEIIEALRNGDESMFPSDNYEIPNYITNTTPIPLKANQFNLSTMAKYRIYDVTCNGNQPLNFSANALIEDIVVVTNCAFHFAADAQLRNSILATTNTSSKSVYAGSKFTLGDDDSCAAGGDSQVLTLGSVELTAAVNVFGSQIIAKEDISMTSNAVGIEGASFIAGGEISITSNGSMGFCNHSGMSRNFEADYFRMAG